MSLIQCPECNKEISNKAETCPNCGCPINAQNTTAKVEIIAEEAPLPQTQIVTGTNITNKKHIIPVIITTITIIVAMIVAGFIFVVQPIMKKSTYDNAISLLNQGDYNEGRELLLGITGYEDVDIILEQTKYESRVYSCISSFKEYLKNPDSLNIYEVTFYYGANENVSDTKKESLNSLFETMGNEPICVIRESAQNGFGGNSTGYSYFIYYPEQGKYVYAGSCDSLDENEIDDFDDKIACKVINSYIDNSNCVGNVDIDRITKIIKNNSYTSIDIIN